MTEIIVRSAKDIKAALLRKAWDGQTGRSPTDLIREIQTIYSRVETMPPGHNEAMAAIIPDQNPVIMRFNARCFFEGRLQDRLIAASTDYPDRSRVSEGTSTIQ